VASSGHPFIAIEKRKTALVALYRRITPTGNLPTSMMTPTDQPGGGIGGLRGVESSTGLTQGITCYETSTYRLVKGDISSEMVLTRAMGSANLSRAFVFISSFEDSVAAVEVLLRRKTLQIFVHIVDDGLEEMVKWEWFFNIHLPHFSHSFFFFSNTLFEQMGKSKHGEGARVQTFSSSSHSFQRLIPFLQHMDDDPTPEIKVGG